MKNILKMITKQNQAEKFVKYFHQQIINKKKSIFIKMSNNKKIVLIIINIKVNRCKLFIIFL